MKIPITILFFCLSSFLSAQNKSEFTFWISSLDKAAFQRDTYQIYSDSIIVKTGPYDFIYFAKNYKKDKIVFKLLLDSCQKEVLRKISEKLKADSIKTIYSNACIIDGMILHFNFEWEDKEKSTTISNYYLSSMDSLVSFVNSIVIEKYKLWYNKDWLENNMKPCPDYLILD